MDKNNPGTWIKYKEGLCTGCMATCCTMPVEVDKDDLVLLGLLDEGDDLRKKTKDLLKQKIIERYRDKTGKATLSSMRDGSCLFLDSTRRCTVYEKRPKTCRNFPFVSSRPGYCPAVKKS
ncbi:YkgJ family cysteine cluster protein [bacterium]|nr:YkgJ family cysteine cluster protein [bacterium]